MRKGSILLGSIVLASTLLATTARADETPQTDQRGKPGLIVTGAILSVFGLGHVAISVAAFASANDAYFKDTDNAIGGVSIAIAATLLGVGVPLMIYGATAKRAPRAQVGLSPNGLFLSGTF